MDSREHLLNSEQVEQMFKVLRGVEMADLQDAAMFFPEATELDENIYEKKEGFFKDDLVYYVKTGHTYVEELDRVMEEQGIKATFDEWSKQREVKSKIMREADEKMPESHVRSPFWFPQAYSGYGAKLAYLYFPQLREENTKNKYLQAKLAMGLNALNDSLDIAFGFMWAKIEGQEENRSQLADLLNIDVSAINREALRTSNPDEVLKLFMNFVTSPKFPVFVERRKSYRANREKNVLERLRLNSGE